MAVTLSSLAGAGAQFFDNNGVPLAGGLIYTYLAGTSTPEATYTSSTGVTAHANPIVLDAAGRIATGEVWLTSGIDYKFLVKTSANVQLGSYDNIPSINDFTSIYAELANTTNPAFGDALVGFRQSNSAGNLSGAVGRTVHQKLQESVSVKDFGAVGDGVTDDTLAIQAAIDSLAGTIYFPDGTYITSATLVMDNNNQTLQGSGRNKASIDADFRGGAVIQIQKARCAVCDLAVSTKFGSSRRNASSFGKTAPDNSVDGNSIDHGIVLLETTSATTYTHIARVDIVYQPAYGLAQFGAGYGTIIEQVGVTSCGGHGMYFDNGGKLNTTLSRNGLVDIESCIIQDCWGDGVAIGIYGPNTSLRFRLINLDVFNNCSGDGGTFQPAFLSANGAEIEASCEQLLIDSCAVGFSINGINMSTSNSVVISNSRIVSITGRGVLINPSCNSIQVVNPYCIGTPPTTGFRVQTGCENVEMRGFISSQWSSQVVDAESEVRLLIDNRDALTVPGSNSLFFNSGIVTSTVSTGNLNVQGLLVSMVGEGGVTDSIVFFRFESGVEVPDGYTFTVCNFQSYNINLQDRTVGGTGNIECQGTIAILQPNESLSFISNGGVYYAINRGIP